jgi:hypothetical protein
VDRRGVPIHPRDFAVELVLKLHRPSAGGANVEIEYKEMEK